jgi:hypothetical protein
MLGLYLFAATLTYLYLRRVGKRAAAFVQIKTPELIWMAAIWPLSVLWLVSDTLVEWRSKPPPDPRLH